MEAPGDATSSAEATGAAGGGPGGSGAGLATSPDGISTVEGGWFGEDASGVALQQTALAPMAMSRHDLFTVRTVSQNPVHGGWLPARDGRSTGTGRGSMLRMHKRATATCAGRGARGRCKVR